jgi:hypothetical protein
MTDPLDGIDLDGASLSDIPEEEPPKRTRRPRSDKGQPRTTRRTTNKQLADDLLAPWAMIASGIAFTSPTTSAVMLQRGEEVTKALVQIAGTNPKMLAALKKTTAVGPAVTLGRTGIEMITALMLDVGRIPPEHPLSAMLGVTDLYYQVHPERRDQQPGNVHYMPNSQGMFTPPAYPGTGA